VCKNAGFTLIELFIIIALMTILAAIAIPNFTIWVSNYRLKNASFDIRSAMQAARVAAVKERNYVVVSFDVANNSYIAFVDNGAGTGGTRGNQVRDGDEKIIKTGNMPSGVDLYEAAFSTGSRTQFNSRGYPTLMGHVYIKNDKSKYHSVVLSKAGHSRIEKSSDGVNWSR